MQITSSYPSLPPPANERPLPAPAATGMQQPPLIEPLQNRNTVDSMTQRFESRYQQQVEKGRHVDIRV